MRKINTKGGWGIIIFMTSAGAISAMGNYAYTSFGIYMKYQAMVDVYYLKQLEKAAEIK